MVASPPPTLHVGIMLLCSSSVPKWFSPSPISSLLAPALIKWGFPRLPSILILSPIITEDECPFWAVPILILSVRPPRLNVQLLEIWICLHIYFYITKEVVNKRYCFAVWSRWWEVVECRRIVRGCGADGGSGAFFSAIQ
jgi:hypothetical protein